MNWPIQLQFCSKPFAINENFKTYLSKLIELSKQYQFSITQRKYTFWFQEEFKSENPLQEILKDKKLEQMNEVMELWKTEINSLSKDEEIVDDFVLIDSN